MANKIAPEEDNSTALALAVGKWKYVSSVKQVAPKVMKWKGLTVEIARELYLARESLNGQKGQRKDPEAPDYIEHTWNDYCEEVGISKRTANGWLNYFVPAELSDSGEDLLLEKRLNQDDADVIADARKAREERIAEYRATGIKPDGWTDADDTELWKRLANERLHRMAAEMQGKRIGSIKPRRDYFADITSSKKTNNRFSLSPDQQILEADMQGTMRSFFISFPDSQSRLKAAFNLSIAIRDIVNELTEYDYREKEQEGDE